MLRTIMIILGSSLPMMWLILKYWLLITPTAPVIVQAARQPYDVHKIIEAFKQSHDDLRILCAHRGLRWNGTAENSRDSYFRATEAGIECIETDIHITVDGKLPMLHDHGLGRTTDVGEQSGLPAYNPFTGKGYSPSIKESNYTGFIEHLHLRDEEGRVRAETVPTLPDLVQNIAENNANVVLQLDFKDKNAVEAAYWQLKPLRNAAGVPANEWCIYKLRSKWWPTPAEFESLSWVQDAFRNNIKLAYLPVYLPKDVGRFDVMSSIKAYIQTNYTISIEIELYSKDGPLQEQLDFIKHGQLDSATSRSVGIFWADGDIVEPVGAQHSRFDRSSFNHYYRENNTVFDFQEQSVPKTADELSENWSVDGHDYRSDFAWILEMGFDWIIADTADDWHEKLKKQGFRNISHFIADGQRVVDPDGERGYYRRAVDEIRGWWTGELMNE